MVENLKNKKAVQALSRQIDPGMTDRLVFVSMTIPTCVCIDVHMCSCKLPPLGCIYVSNCARCT